MRAGEVDHAPALLRALFRIEKLEIPRNRSYTRALSLWAEEVGDIARDAIHAATKPGTPYVIQDEKVVCMRCGAEHFEGQCICPHVTGDEGVAL